MAYLQNGIKLLKKQFLPVFSVKELGRKEDNDAAESDRWKPPLE